MGRPVFMDGARLVSHVGKSSLYGTQPLDYNDAILAACALALHGKRDSAGKRRYPVNMFSIDDTQPTAPVRPEHWQQPAPPDDEGGASGGPGCLVWGALGVMGVLLSLAIVVLAGTAGWTEGQRLGDRHASATQARQIEEQLTRIPEDVAEGNEYLIGLRLNFLETLAPNLNTVPGLRQTATAVHLSNNQPTATTTATEVPPMVEDVPPVEDTPPAVVDDDDATSDGMAFDLDTLLDEARQSMALREYGEAYETLDVIIRIDPNYQRTLVRDLTHEALISWALTLFRTADLDDLAEAIRVTDLAENYGDVGDLSYERFMAEQYLDVQRTIGTGNHARAIRMLTDLINNYQATYKGVDFRQMLFNEYVAYGDAWGFGGQYCQAVTQYNMALNLFSNASVVAKRDNAQEICERGPLLTPDAPGSEGGNDSQPVAPIGVPGT